MSSVKIYISCHKPADYIQTDVFTPIQVGCALPGHHRLSGMSAYDNDGDNISSLNASYCELTAQYWAWKNADLDYYGFCHYRRYFNLSDEKYEEDPYGNIMEPYLDQETIDRYQLTDERVQQLIQQYDVIVTERKDIRKLPGGMSTPREQYKAAKMLHLSDYDRLLRIIEEKFPDYAPAAKKFNDGHFSCYCNMYILRKDLFFAYCAWMFAVLKEFCQETDMSHFSTEALRTPGHLSERLFNIYLLYLEQTQPDLRIREVQCVEIEHTDPQETVLKPAFPGADISDCANAELRVSTEAKDITKAAVTADGPLVVPVVFAANNNFVPMFAACFRSMLDHISPENRYDVVLIESDVTAENQQILRKMAAEYTNVSLRFYDPGHLLKHYKLKANAHISVETYYRFLIQTVLKDYSKVLYLDCDTIIKADVAELYRTDIDGYMLAAVRDVDFLGQINGADPSAIEYCQKSFHMKDPYNYFQAGVLLFNEDEMRKAHSQDEWLTFATTPYRYNDQDVLNLYCEGRVKYLDMAWNLVTDNNHERVKKIIVYAPDSVQKEYHAAHAAPKIIHYAGFMKPWHRPTEDYGHEFWETLRRTDYYEELLYRMGDGISWWTVFENNKKNGRGEKLHLRILNALMPLGSGRRAWLDNIYRKVHWKSL